MAAAAAPALEAPGIAPVRRLLRALRNGLLAALGMALVALVFQVVVGPLLGSVQVDETVTVTLSRLFWLLLPFAGYLAAGTAARNLPQRRQALILALSAVCGVYLVVTGAQAVLGAGPFAPRPSLQFSATQTDDGILVESLVAGGVAELAGLQTGDVITAIRRDRVNLTQLNQRVGLAEEDDPFRLRYVRDGEEAQLTVRVALEGGVDSSAILTGLFIALAVAALSIYWPGRTLPYILLAVSLLPLAVGYLWLIIATFSYRTRGILPLNSEGGIGGLTLENWGFLFGQDIAGLEFSIWQVTLNSFLLAIFMTAVVLLVSSMAGYALSRMSFAGRKSFLSFTLILHGFPAVTLLIPIFFVLLNLGNLPLVGDLFGFNTLGGITLVMVAFDLPLGIWLMKGFFDHIPWDMERSALIDGASRWRVYREIVLPQIRPGMLALGIFAFIGGWNAFLIPQTYSIGSGTVNLPVFLNELIDETAPVDWNQVAAVGLFQLIPIFIFFVFAQEYLLNIYAGGTKGSS